MGFHRLWALFAGVLVIRAMPFGVYNLALIIGSSDFLAALSSAATEGQKDSADFRWHTQSPCCLGALKGVSTSVQVLLNGIEAVMVLTATIPK